MIVVSPQKLRSLHYRKYSKKPLFRKRQRCGEHTDKFDFAHRAFICKNHTLTAEIEDETAVSLSLSK